MSKAYLSLGGNVGDKRKNIIEAMEFLNKHKEIQVTQVSSYYETEPVGYTEQEWFLNVAVEIKTTLMPIDLLDYCNYVEKELKRERIIRWGPRTIDIDILLYEEFSSQSEKLTVPHKSMFERAFVMIPLYEINPDLIINQAKIKDIVDNLNDKQVRKIK
ncbi:2-amino-4-hydroxy-6-hydroxymethyldihydropteridine diphosphokinase [Clostridium grantii]|uniref:2-amino-4-hydroxy-6-hydroxymethyldihydropteridine diphosphokinase n=1 Tax=Clostridium grantii DSM 8605 TaxID=1121316 RepID=A0A1M5QIZ5_9CLOT|nr:2-amino-4-hydroxy-6-hydroxymethyldihydropteridine diphosphokinase [Clostridium grantii]SHH13918.1 2-amino-4-hydroxy-6-hydroxymethyldihydropteridinediphosphokinase [Clostridium grantii DSM 8605]